MKVNIKELEVLVVELQTRVTHLEATISSFKPRDRGPQSTRTMTDEDATRIKFGDLKAVSHKAAAEALNLSYGQIYSCREGYTFKHIKDATVAA